jgi:hypothetical protein
METKNLPDWTECKNDPSKRISYHYEWFQSALAMLEDYTRDMKGESNSRQRRQDANLIRLVADGMVKCFDQLYCDIHQGFPGYRAVWLENDSAKRISDERMICELNNLMENMGIKNLLELRHYVDTAKDAEVIHEFYRMYPSPYDYTMVNAERGMLWKHFIADKLYRQYITDLPEDFGWKEPTYILELPEELREEFIKYIQDYLIKHLGYTEEDFKTDKYVNACIEQFKQDQEYNKEK